MPIQDNNLLSQVKNNSYKHGLIAFHTYLNSIHNHHKSINSLVLGYKNSKEDNSQLEPTGPKSKSPILEIPTWRTYLSSPSIKKKGLYL